MQEQAAITPGNHLRRTLIGWGAAIGVILAGAEVCWAYFLPVLFPLRKYELPVETFPQFVGLATVIDVFLMLMGAILLGGVIAVLRRSWSRARSYQRWPETARALLLLGGLSYLFIGLANTYYIFTNTTLKILGGVIGVVLLGLISCGAVYGLARLNRRFPKATYPVAWVTVLVLLACLTAPNYSRHQAVCDLTGELPSFGAKHRPNVLIVTLDTQRADYLGCYGNKLVRTPVLDALAKDGCIFETAFCQAPTTTPSHCSIMTSAYAAHHGALNGSAMKVRIPCLAEIFKSNGYQTAAFVSSTMVRSTNSGLHRGFDYYEDSISRYSSLFRHDELQFVLAVYLLSWFQHNELRGDIVTDRALAWLNGIDATPFFCWIHYYDPHGPYAAPEPYRHMYKGKMDPNLPLASRREAYAGEVTYTDAQLGRFIGQLKERGLYEDTLIVATADHGEAFGEMHGETKDIGHGLELYDATQLVPLIVKMPAMKGAATHVKGLVQLVDLAPTLLEYMGARQPKTFEGESLLAVMKGEQRSQPAVGLAETVDVAGALGLGGLSGSPKSFRLMALRTDDIKYICDASGQREELYVVSSDPDETQNVRSAKEALAQACNKRVVGELGTSLAQTAELDPQAVEQLRSLGYIVSGSEPNAK